MVQILVTDDAELNELEKKKKLEKLKQTNREKERFIRSRRRRKKNRVKGRMSSSRFGNTIPILISVALRKTSLLFHDVALLIADLISVAASAVRFSRWLFRPTVHVEVEVSHRYSPTSLMIVRQHRWFFIAPISASISCAVDFDLIFEKFQEDFSVFCLLRFVFVCLIFSFSLEIYGKLGQNVYVCNCNLMMESIVAFLLKWLRFMKMKCWE